MHLKIKGNLKFIDRGKADALTHDKVQLVYLDTVRGIFYINVYENGGYVYKWGKATHLNFIFTLQRGTDWVFKYSWH